MTPQEKAEELVYKMYDKMFYYRDGYNSSDVIGAAKQCALIAVDEIIEQWQYIDAYIANGMGELSPNLKYWYEVKHELTKQQEQ
jgi:hypothetical protein